MTKGKYIRTKEIRKKNSESAKERYKNHKHPMLGRKHTDEAKKKVSIANKGNVSPMKGKHHNDESKIKMSIAKKGKELSDEHRKNLSEARKGMKFSEEHKKNISISMSSAMKGKVFSDERNKKISESLKGKKKSDEHIKHMKEVWSPEKKKIAREEWLQEKNPNWNPNREEVYAPYGENFYNKTIRNRKWNLQSGRDMLTGTILNPNKKPAYHHIDYDKSNDDPNNHCFMSSNNHMRITGNQRNHIKSERYKKILQENTLALKNGQIPKYWSQINKELFRQEKLKQLNLDSYII